MAGLFTAAQAVQAAGRGDDRIAAHITVEEAALLKARGGRGSRNPHTGLLEFGYGDDDGNDDTVGNPGDENGPSEDQGAGPSDDEISGFMDTIAADPNPGQHGWTSNSGIGGDTWGEILTGGNLWDAMQYGGHKIGQSISSTIKDMLDNPIRTLVNGGIGVAKFSNPVLAAAALANSVSGMFNGPTAGGYAQQAYNAKKAPTAAAPTDGILSGSVGDTTLIGSGPMPGDPDYIGTTDQQRQTLTPEPQGNPGAEVQSATGPAMTGLLTTTRIRTPNPNFVSPAERFKSDYYAPSPPLFRFDATQGQLVRVN